MSRPNIHKSIRSLRAGIVGLMIGFSSISHAAVDISSVPLFLTTQVTPNIILALDDSGSMDGEVLFPTNDGAAWWNTNGNSFAGFGVNEDVTQDVAASASTLNFNVAGGSGNTWKKYVYLFPNGHNNSYNGKRKYNDATNDHFAIPPIAQLAWARSSDFNKGYFDPSVSYTPWPSTATKTYANSNPQAASVDPETSVATFDLTQNVESNEVNWQFRFYDGMTIEAGARVHDGSAWKDIITPVIVSSDSAVKAGKRGVRYFPATFYTQNLLPVTYGYAAPVLAGYSPGTTLPDLFRYEIKPDNFTSLEAYGAAIQNFANWFTYYRKRHLATRGGVAESFADIGTARVGWFRINNSNPSVTMRSLSSTADKSALFDDVYDYVVGQGLGGTPNRTAINEAGKLFRNDTDIIQYACQSNATVLFTDGYSNTEKPDDNNYDNGKGSPYSDSISGTIADLAMKYYDSSFVPLRSDLDSGRVPVPTECSLTNRDLSLDCNRDLHMNTYAVTLGTKGILFDPDNPVDPYATPPSWWTTFTVRNPTAVDDLWHATINGRGALLNANTPADVSSEMKKILDTILAKVGSASSVAANSTRLDTDTRIFQAKFDSTDWSGEVLAYSVGTTGEIRDEIWSTDNTITRATTRNLLTWNDTLGDGRDFNTTLTNYSSSQLAALGADDTERQALIAWVRGSQTSEQSKGGAYRNRARLLGDVINSDPTFVGADDFRYNLLPEIEGSTYAAYVQAKKAATRPPLLLFGANDGMLHGLNAINGQELFGYIPGSVYPKLVELSDPTYTHKYIVDATPRAGDAYINSAWSTVAVGGTGVGGRTLFAIDITDPSVVDKDDVLWEITGKVETSSPATVHGVGEGISQPTIVRLADGNWGAIFGNGYNSGDNVKLVVVRLDNGEPIRVIDTGVSGLDNGLGPVSPVDVNGDRITDFIYAGDLKGNLWKFDLTSANNGQWGVSSLFSTESQQPITSRPEIGRHPDGGYMVYFGTGSYFRADDNIVGDTPALQRFYGIRDTDTSVDFSSLVRQTVVSETEIASFGPARVYSNNLVNYGSKRGWYLDLRYPEDGSNKGERVVSTPILRFGRIIFTSIIPSQDPCDFGGSSWINELDALTGQRLTYSVFDVNGDGLIDDNDFVQLDDGTKVPVGGKGFNEIIKTPGIVGAGEKEYKYTSGSSGTLGVTAEAGDPAPVGRQSWRQLQ